jgi:hypothetical protein
MTSDKSPAEAVFDELSERLAEPEKPQTKYLKLAPPVNRAMKRAAAKQRRLRANHLETWKRQLERVGINWEDIVVERLRKAKEGIQVVTKPAGDAAEGVAVPPASDE